MAGGTVAVVNEQNKINIPDCKTVKAYHTHLSCISDDHVTCSLLGLDPVTCSQENRWSETSLRVTLRAQVRGYLKSLPR